MITESMPLRFLVVDDSEDIRDLLIRVVELLGHTADQACDGAVALEALAMQRYDFMLLDLTMPRMTGQDVLRWLYLHPEWARGLRVIVVSAAADDEHDALRDLGAHAVLAKPLRLQRLRELISSLTQVSSTKG